MRTEPKILSVISALSADFKVLEAREVLLKDSERKAALVKLAADVFCMDLIESMEFFQNDLDELTLSLANANGLVIGYVGVNDSEG